MAIRSGAAAKVVPKPPRVRRSRTVGSGERAGSLGSLLSCKAECGATSMPSHHVSELFHGEAGEANRDTPVASLRIRHKRNRSYRHRFRGNGNRDLRRAESCGSECQDRERSPDLLFGPAVVVGVVLRRPIGLVHGGRSQANGIAGNGRFLLPSFVPHNGTRLRWRSQGAQRRSGSVASMPRSQCRTRAGSHGGVSLIDCRSSTSGCWLTRISPACGRSRSAMR